MSSTGRRLRESNEEILKYINQLRDQRNELGFLVEKQKIEKANLEAEMARISYKLNLINKSLGQRIHALKLYDATLTEIENKYKGLADSTQGLLTQVRKESSTLESSIDKRIGTENVCKNCPNCDSLPSVIPEDVNMNTERPIDAPTKQPFEGERRGRKLSEVLPNYKASTLLEGPEMDSTNPLYSRAMEYPMVLSPMMQGEHHDETNKKVRSHNNESLNSKHKESHSESIAGPEAPFVPPFEEPPPVETKAKSASETSSKNSNLMYSESKSGNFIDGDYPDMKPSRHISEPRSLTRIHQSDKPKEETPKPKEESPKPIVAESPKPTEKPPTQPEEFSEVSEEPMVLLDEPPLVENHVPVEEYPELVEESPIPMVPPIEDTISDDSQMPPQSPSEKKDSPYINEFDEVIEDVKSGSDSISSGVLTPTSSFLKKTIESNTKKEKKRRHSILKMTHEKEKTSLYDYKEYGETNKRQTIPDVSKDASNK